MIVRPEYRKNRIKEGTQEADSPDSLSAPPEQPVSEAEGTPVPTLGGDPASREGAERPSNVNTPSSPDPEQDEKPKKRVGRPKKSALAKKKPGGRGTPGRPKGDAAIMNEYKARMLSSPKSRKVLDKVFQVALEDGHKHQAACMKMVMDRIAPLSSFEADGKKGRGASGINITITNTGSTSIDGTSTDDIQEGEWEPVE